ncbi:MAG: LacI family transcriptional regulator [Patescibacteria group bacterium]|nr:LacI family transcriptional regulator [Patescibacteria group bacterium]
MLQKDIAAMVGVDKSVVSKVIHNEPDVGEETRRKIQNIISESGYRPHAAARSLKSARTHSIGLCFYDTRFVEVPTFSTVITGVLDIAGAEGYSLMVTSTRSNGNKNHIDIIKAAAERRIDGALIYDDLIDNDTLLRLYDMKFPFVLINRCIRDREMLPSVTTDFRQGYQSFGKHLIELGHRRICGIVPFSHWYMTEEKVKGFKDAITEGGLVPEENPVINYINNAEWDYQNLNNLVRSLVCNTKVTAGILPDDNIASRTNAFFRELGYKVPDQFSIIGYNNTLESEHSIPGITTINTNNGEIGRQAARLLLRQIRGKRIENKNIIIQPNLVTRASTAHPS